MFALFGNNGFKSFCKFLRRIVTVMFEKVIERNNLTNDRNILAGEYREFHSGKLDIKDDYFLIV